MNRNIFQLGGIETQYSIILPPVSAGKSEANLGLALHDGGSKEEYETDHSFIFVAHSQTEAYEGRKRLGAGIGTVWG